MRTSYPRFYQTTQSDEDTIATINIWYEIFKNDNTALVNKAVVSLIQRLEFPPTIADVRKEMAKLVEAVSDKPSAMEEWNAIRNAIRNSGYHAGEMFEKLPPIAKRFVGSPQQLRDWGMSTDFNDSVVRGQFLKQYEVLEERERYKALISPEISDIVERLAEQKGTKLIGG